MGPVAGAQPPPGGSSFRTVAVSGQGRRGPPWFGFGFGIWCLGFWVWDSGFGVWGLGFGVWGFGFEVWVLEFGVLGLRFGFGF